MIALRKPTLLLIASLATLLLCGLAATARAASMDFVYPPPEAAGDERHL